MANHLGNPQEIDGLPIEDIATHMSAIKKSGKIT